MREKNEDNDEEEACCINLMTRFFLRVNIFIALDFGSRDKKCYNIVSLDYLALFKNPKWLPFWPSKSKDNYKHAMPTCDSRSQGIIE